MEIHRFEKLWLGVSLVLIIGFIATIAYGAIGPGVAMIGDDGGTVNANDLANDPHFGDPGVEKVGPNRYAVYVVAQQFSFDPGSNNPIRLPADSRVTFYVTSADVVHGFEIVGTNVNSMAIPGQVAKFTVEFDEPGQYGIVCNEYCGAGHHTMEGSLVVVPPSQYEGSGGSGNSSDVSAEGTQ